MTARKDALAAYTTYGWAIMSSEGWERPVLLGRGWVGVDFAAPTHALAGQPLAIYPNRRQCRAAAKEINALGTLTDARCVRVRVEVSAVLSRPARRGKR